jgi:hypothetical protein
MTIRTSLLGGAALGALVCLALAPVAQAATTHHKHVKTRVVMAADTGVKDEVAALKAEVQSLEAWKDQETADHAATQQQVQQLQGQLAESNNRLSQAEAQVEAQIQTIPGDVDSEVKKHAPKTDKIYYKGITLTLGGFAAAESVYRTKDNVADIGSQFQKLPYDNNVLAHQGETRLTARQSRISFLAQGNPTPDMTASFYGEFDFLAGPQTANYNESNSFSPRVRNLYGALDWNDSGWHFLAGQNWSLATMNTKGISPRNELPPPTIDAQYVPGFVWARQPQLRVTKDFDDKQVWVAFSVENPQTTFASAATGTGTTFSGVTATDASACLSQCDAANSPSFNQIPDVIGKIAFEPIIGGAQPIHAEVFGVFSQYEDRVAIGTTGQAHTLGLTPGDQSQTSTGGGVGGGVTINVWPNLLDIEGSAMTGKGIGRYGAGQLPDAVVGPNGALVAIPETMALGGITLHATPQLDLYVFGGGEFEGSEAFNPSVGGTTLHLGYGNPFATLGNCFVELGTCSPDTKSIDQITVGFWDKAFSGSFGQIRIGVQYSHTDLKAFPGLAGANTAGFAPTSTVRPTTSDDMVFTSFRYYPF